MAEIPFAPMPAGAVCQEASIFSRASYLACGTPAVALIYHERDRRGYLMCAGCADHNVRNRSGKWVTGAPETEYLRKA
jgi:hypothetical protein